MPKKRYNKLKAWAQDMKILKLNNFKPLNKNSRQRNEIMIKKLNKSRVMEVEMNNQLYLYICYDPFYVFT